MGLKKPHRQNRDLGCIYRWRLFVGGVQFGGGRVFEVNGEDGERHLFKLSPTSS